MNARNLVAALTVVIVVIGGLVSFTQCGKADRALLARADSLIIADSAGSALSVLQLLDSTNLSSENEAYYALLKTTALYKLGEPIENDSLISIAVRYYTDKDDQQKLTSALMYRGAVYSDYLNFKRLAVDDYKEAEKIADTADFETMGLLNFRIGILYQNSYIENSEPIERYKRAARYFQKAQNEPFENYSYGYLGQMYIAENYDSAYYYINKTINWAIEQGDQAQLLNGCRVDLSKLYQHYNINLDKSRDLLLNVYSVLDIVGGDIFHNLADTYSKLGKIDSATYFAAQFSQFEQLVDTMSYHMMLESLAVAQNDYKTAYKCKIIASQAAEKIVSQGKAEEYYAIDKQYDNSAANSKIEILNQEKITHQLIIAVILLILSVVILCSWFFVKMNRKAVIDQERKIDHLQNEIKNHQYSAKSALEKKISLIQGLNKTIEERKELESTLRGLAEDRIKIMRQLLEIKYQHKDNPGSFFRRVDEVLLLNKKSHEDCLVVIDIANQLYGNIIDSINRKCPTLNFNDKLLIAFACMEFSAIETMAFMSMVSSEAVYSARHRLASKLGVSNLHEYIKETKRILIQK